VQEKNSKIIMKKPAGKYFLFVIFTFLYIIEYIFSKNE